MSPGTGPFSIEEARFKGAVDGLSAVGTGAAIIDRNECLRAVNKEFEAQLGAGCVLEHRKRIVFPSTMLNKRFSAAVQEASRSASKSSSIAMRPSPGMKPKALNLIPLRGLTRAVLDADGLLVLVADGANPALPRADLLRQLFDLTPAEANITRHLLEGQTLAHAAVANGTTYETARAHLKAVFSKTGLSRQADLVRVLARYGAPGS